MNMLAALISLVDQGKIVLISFFYPKVSPTVTLEWVGSYESLIDREQTFSKPADSFHGVIDNLYQLIGITEIQVSDQYQKLIVNDLINAEPYLDIITDFIDERVDFGDESWLLGLEYSIKEELPDRWCGTLEGAQWINMPFIKCGPTLEQACRELSEIINVIDLDEV